MMRMTKCLRKSLGFATSAAAVLMTATRWHHSGRGLASRAPLFRAERGLMFL